MENSRHQIKQEPSDQSENGISIISSVFTTNPAAIIVKEPQQQQQQPVDDGEAYEEIKELDFDVPSSTRFECTRCHVFLDSWIDLRCHLEIVHCFGDCLECYRYKLFNEFNRHLMNVHKICIKIHSTEEPSNICQPSKGTHHSYSSSCMVKCNLCSALYRNMHHFDAHCRNKHAEVYNRKLIAHLATTCELDDFGASSSTSKPSANAVRVFIQPKDVVIRSVAPKRDDEVDEDAEDDVTVAKVDEVQKTIPVPRKWKLNILRCKSGNTMSKKLKSDRD